jgi:hypothetical protein
MNRECGLGFEVIIVYCLRISADKPIPWISIPPERPPEIVANQDPG